MHTLKAKCLPNTPAAKRKKTNNFTLILRTIEGLSWCIYKNTLSLDKSGFEPLTFSL